MKKLINALDRIPFWVFGTPLAILFVFTGVAGEHASNGGHVPTWWWALDCAMLNLTLPVLVLWTIKGVRVALLDLSK